jgi:hypothetical protein
MPTPQPRPAQPARRISPIVWILGGLGAIVVLLGIALVAGGLFIFHKARQAGLDPELMRTNPELAMTKFLAAVNPDIEVLSLDERKRLITVRNKRENKVYTIDFEQAKQGNFAVQTSEGERVEISSGAGGIEVSTPEGTARISTTAKVPAWIPSYPGSSARGTFSSESAREDVGSFSFTTTDNASKVVEWYSAEFTKGGMQVSKVDSGGGVASVTAESEAGNYSASVAIESKPGEAAVTVTYRNRK